MGRRLRTHLDLMRPDVSNRVHTKQGCQKKLDDRHAESNSLKLVTQSLLAILVVVRSGWQVQLSLSRVNPVR